MLWGPGSFPILVMLFWAVPKQTLSPIHAWVRNLDICVLVIFFIQYIILPNSFSWPTSTSLHPRSKIWTAHNPPNARGIREADFLTNVYRSVSQPFISGRTSSRTKSLLFLMFSVPSIKPCACACSPPLSCIPAHKTSLLANRLHCRRQDSLLWLWSPSSTTPFWMFTPRWWTSYLNPELDSCVILNFSSTYIKGNCFVTRRWVERSPTPG